ncbi:MAG TPA: hypothetical protein VFB58_11145 [Chloroflexota bacterium]|nr:hypothetical protein [Chloroflexota bacterium]
MLTRRIAVLGNWFAWLGTPADSRAAVGLVGDLPGRFAEDCQSETITLAFVWGGLVIVFALGAIAIGAVHSAIAGGHPHALLTAFFAPTIFALTGVVLQGIRAMVASVLVSKIGRGGYWEPPPMVRWLLTPRDADLLVQLAVAVLFVRANT